MSVKASLHGMLTVPDTASSSGRWPGTGTTPGCTSSPTRKCQARGPAVVEQPHLLPVGQAAGSGVGRVHALLPWQLTIVRARLDQREAA